MPSTTFPNTTCFPSSHSVFAVQIKTETRSCSDRRSPWTGYLDRCASSRSSHRRT
ncbi:hypothetical protein HanIR_Chr01g0018961 [Helianthus annuus]|nr:hypothetical protein HanIR_Chr01g0018961 [Helianthus annuus]